MPRENHDVVIKYQKACKAEKIQYRMIDSNTRWQAWADTYLRTGTWISRPYKLFPNQAMAVAGFPHASLPVSRLNIYGQDTHACRQEAPLHPCLSSRISTPPMLVNLHFPIAQNFPALAAITCHKSSLRNLRHLTTGVSMLCWLWMHSGVKTSFWLNERI